MAMEEDLYQINPGYEYGYGYDTWSHQYLSKGSPQTIVRGFKKFSDEEIGFQN